MTIIARPAEQSQQAPRRVRIQARDPLFFRAFAQGYAVAQQDYDGQPISDDTMYGYLRRMMAAPELSPCWKAGVITGWFAALYHIPCTFEEQPKLKPVQPPCLPRPIHLHYNVSRSSKNVTLSVQSKGQSKERRGPRAKGSQRAREGSMSAQAASRPLRFPLT